MQLAAGGRVNRPGSLLAGPGSSTVCSNCSARNAIQAPVLMRSSRCQLIAPSAFRPDAGAQHRSASRVAAHASEPRSRKDLLLDNVSDDLESSRLWPPVPEPAQDTDYGEPSTASGQQLDAPSSGAYVAPNNHEASYGAGSEAWAWHSGSGGQGQASGEQQRQDALPQPGGPAYSAAAEADTWGSGVDGSSSQRDYVAPTSSNYYGSAPADASSALSATPPTGSATIEGGVSPSGATSWQEGSSSAAAGPGPSSGQAPLAGWRPKPAASDWGEPEPFTEWGGAPVQRGPSQALDYDGSGWPEESAGVSGSSGAGAGGYVPQPGAPLQGDEYFSDSSRQQPLGAEGPSSGAGPAGGSAPSVFPSDIVPLARSDAERLLPFWPNNQQADFYRPKTLQERIVQVVGSIGASVILSKAVVIAAPAMLYPIWSPWIRASLMNIELYTKAFKSVGLWRAQVLDVQLLGNPGLPNPFSSDPPIVSLLVGDPWTGGARSQMEFPYVQRAEYIRAGDAVELLVLGKDDEFVSFKVVREVYLPETGLWLADYPFVARDVFLAISLEVERQRQAEYY